MCGTIAAKGLIRMPLCATTFVYFICLSISPVRMVPSTGDQCSKTSILTCSRTSECKLRKENTHSKEAIEVSYATSKKSNRWPLISLQLYLNGFWEYYSRFSCIWKLIRQVGSPPAFNRLLLASTHSVGDLWSRSMANRALRKVIWEDRRELHQSDVKVVVIPMKQLASLRI